jgi:hypothetical protein
LNTNCDHHEVDAMDCETGNPDGRDAVIGPTARLFGRLAAVALFAAASPAVAATTDGDQDPGVDSSRQVAVVALDDSTEVGALMKSTSQLLDRKKYDVVAGERLASRLEEHQTESIPESLSTKFAGISNTIGDGVKSFFYKGRQTTVEKLTPIFDLGMGHPEVLARRPDFAEQIFQAGLVLVRAYRKLDQIENAEAAASLLVRRMPGREPSPSFAPPNIIRFFREQREALADKQTRLTVEKVGHDDCVTYVNGNSVEGRNDPLVVAPGESYYLTLECGHDSTPVWKTSVEAGDHATVPVSGADPLDFTMENANFRQRKLAEAHLRLIAHWTEISRVIGVFSPTDEAEDGESVLVARVDHGGEATWSDTVDRAEIRGAVARVMPELDPEAAAETAPAASRRDTRAGWLDWTLVGVGAAGLAAGTYVGVTTERRARRVQCGTGARTDCAGIQPLEFDSDAEASRAEREINMARATYIGALAAGAGLTTWGIIRLATRPDRPPERAARPPQFGVTPTPDGPRVFFHTRW